MNRKIYHYDWDVCPRWIKKATKNQLVMLLNSNGTLVDSTRPAADKELDEELAHKKKKGRQREKTMAFTSGDSRPKKNLNFHVSWKLITFDQWTTALHPIPTYSYVNAPNWCKPTINLRKFGELTKIDSQVALTALRYLFFPGQSKHNIKRP